MRDRLPTHTPPPHAGFPMSAHLSRLRLFRRYRERERERGPESERARGRARVRAREREQEREREREIKRDVLFGEGVAGDLRRGSGRGAGEGGKGRLPERKRARAVLLYCCHSRRPASQRQFEPLVQAYRCLIYSPGTPGRTATLEPLLDVLRTTMLEVLHTITPGPHTPPSFSPPRGSPHQLWQALCTLVSCPLPPTDLPSRESPQEETRIIGP